MPVHWLTETGAPADAGAPFLSGFPVRAVLRPNRSLSRAGFAWVMLVTWLLMLVPLVSLLGTVALWVMLPFCLAALAALWFGIERNYHDGTLTETLSIDHDLIEVIRREPRGAELSWSANPYWVRATLRKKGGPVDNYLTLKGGGREIELGAFLSPEERADLHDLLLTLLAKCRAAPHQA
jgi:uncharacterized membrane protein